MKKRNLLFAAIALLAMVAVAMALVPAPPVNQNLGLYDTRMINVSVDTCKGCHQSPPDIHHFMLGAGNTNLGCMDCHPLTGPVGSQTLTISRNCHDCHDGTAWTVNPAINLTTIRGAPGRPHHNTTKNSSSSTFQAAYWAINRQCTNCHGTSYLDNYNDGHPVPAYNTSIVTPMADFKINSTIGNGREWGGCAACHDESASSVPFINSNYGTHHYETTSMLGRQCNYCHVSQGSRAEPIPDISSDPNAYPLRVWFNATYPSYVAMFGWDASMQHIELRNNTILTGMGDAINGTGCQKCHSVRDLHNIETDSPGRNVSQTLADEIPGYGHIGNNSDCNGCHAGWAGAVTNPFPGPTSIMLDSVTPGKLVAGVATDATLIGSSFVQNGYTTTVLVDGVAVTTVSITDAQIVATLPALSVGVHSIQVEKGGVTSKLATLTAVAPVTITSAKLASGVLTITGTGFGANAQQIVTISKADGSILPSDSITSWRDTQIVATSAAAAVGDSVTVTTTEGSATAIIETGTVQSSITVTVPNGGENWKRGTTQTITWTSVGSTGANVKIELLKGTVVKVLSKSTPNDGSFDWAISKSQAVGTDYKIRVTSTSDSAYTDTSDNYFQISK